MLESVGKLNYAIVLCDDIDRMKAFYREFFPFPVVSETETSLALGAGHVLLALRKRERSYDGRGGGAASPGVQLPFLCCPTKSTCVTNGWLNEASKSLNRRWTRLGVIERSISLIPRGTSWKSMPRFDIETVSV